MKDKIGAVLKSKLENTAPPEISNICQLSFSHLSQLEAILALNQVPRE